MLIWSGFAHSDNRRSSGWRFVEIGGCAVQDRRCDGGPLVLSIARDGQLLLEASRQSGSLSATALSWQFARRLTECSRMWRLRNAVQSILVTGSPDPSGSGPCPLTSCHACARRMRRPCRHCRLVAQVPLPMTAYHSGNVCLNDTATLKCEVIPRKELIRQLPFSSLPLAAVRFL